ncbi:MAG: hypothetical protein V5A64_07235 [Candidatus Thermoplasmatota archaeon]
MKYVLDADKFVHNVFKEGIISTLIGLPGGGKTNIAGNFMDMGVNRGYHVYTNCRFFKPSQIEKACKKDKLPAPPSFYQKNPPQIHTVRKLSDLIKGCLTTEPNMVILDESGVHVSSYQSTSSDTVNWRFLAMLIRHLSSSKMLVAQSKNSVVPDLRERMVEFELRVRQIKKNDYLITVGTRVEQRDPYTGEIYTRFDVLPRDRYHMVPLCRFPIDGKDFPYFEQDLDVKQIFQELNIFNSLEVRETNSKGVINGVAVVDKMLKKKDKSKKYDLSKKELAFNIFENGFTGSLKDLASVLNISYDYAKQLHSEYAY